MTVLEGLRLVAQAGAPAQRHEATRLIEVLSREPADEVARETAMQLVDAFLHDPYLERG
jgi:hypothetical protein